jgi:trimethylamine---corrinoid protein Co-methyltransferase
LTLLPEEVASINREKIEPQLALTVLGKEKIATIHDLTLKLLETVGMKISGERTKKLLLANGCRLKNDDLILIPKQLIEYALRTVPKELIIYNLDGAPSMVLNQNRTKYFGTHADQLEFIDPFKNQIRKFRKADIALMSKIAGALPNIDFILSVGMAVDVPPQIQSQISFIETVKYFRKPINFSTNDIQGLRDIVEIASLIAGSTDNLKGKPFIFYYCEPLPPFTHPQESTEKILICAENKIPLVYMPFSMMGGTSPLNYFGTLAQCNAEVLTGLVISQIANAGTPFIYGAMPSIFDMKTTIGSYSAPELHLLIAAAAEISRHYDLPFYGTAGCSDAKVIDEQAMTEITYEIFSSLISQANLIHDVGVMDHCNSLSPEIVVLANEIIEGLKVYCHGIPNESNSSSIFDLMSKVGPGNHYLGEEHTFSNFKNIWYPQIFSRAMFSPKASSVREKIRHSIKDINNNYTIPGLDQELQNELQKWETKLAQRI